MYSTGAQSAVAPAVTLTSGQVVDDRFVVVEPLGRGGDGSVFGVTDQKDGRELALKLLAPSLAQGAHLTRFIREYRVASRLRDLRFVRAHHFGRFESSYYFTMDLVAGGSLASQAWGRKLPAGVAVGLALQVLGALDALHHQNITHRDLKPLNLLLDGPLPLEGAGSDGPCFLPRVRLTDFGIARVGDLSEDTNLGQTTGTPRYMAPELFALGSTDPRVDLFALGVVLHELLTGSHPLSGTGHTRTVIRRYLDGQLATEPVDRSPADLPPALSAVLNKLLSRSPWQRPRTAALVFDELWSWWTAERPPYLLPEPPAPLRGSPYLAAAPLLGRDDELSRAGEFFEELLTSEPLAPDNDLSGRERQERLCSSVLVLSGVPGVGKSRLALRVLRLAHGWGMRVLEAQCRREVEQLYQGVAEVLRALPEFDEPADEPADDPRPWRRIPSLLDREYELLRREPADGIEAIRQHELRQRFFFEHSLARLLRWSEDEPTVVVVEDLQWADPSTSSLLAFWVRAVALARAEGYPGKIAFCLTTRPESADNAVHRLEALLENQKNLEQPAVRLELEPLSQDQSAELVAELLMEPLGPAITRFSQALFGDRSPTPLYIEQALRLLLYQGLLTQGCFDQRGRWLGRWNIDPALAHQAQLPATVQGAIGERAARLSVQTLRLLTLASVEGRQFTVGLLAQASGLHQNEVLDSLDEAAQAGFVQPLVETEASSVIDEAHRSFRFLHERYREALYDGQEEPARQELHRKLAQALLALFGATVETAEALAHHATRGGDDGSAFEFGVLAADSALDRGAFDRAAELYGAALAAAERAGLPVTAELHGRYADACVATGAFDKAQHHYQERIAALPPGLERWDTQRRAAELNYRRRDFKNATAPLEALLGEMGYPLPRTELGYTAGDHCRRRTPPDSARDILARPLLLFIFWPPAPESRARRGARTSVVHAHGMLCFS